MFVTRRLSHLVKFRGRHGRYLSVKGPQDPTPNGQFDSSRLDVATATDAPDATIQGQTSFSTPSYPAHEAERLQAQANRSRKVNAPETRDDSDKTILLFPGQGAQLVGMAKELTEVPNVKDLFDRASHILGYDLLHLCNHGPPSELDRTVHSQPAMVVCSLAMMEKLYNESPHLVENCFKTAGFSVGEITALIFSGALSFEDGIRLIEARGKAMQFCSEAEPSGMMTIFFGAKNDVGLGLQAAKKWILERDGISEPVCVIANHLYTGAKVVAGQEQALHFLDVNKRDFGIRKTRRIPVSGAFHTKLMAPAVPIFKEALKQCQLNDPRIPVHSNYDMRIIRHSDQVAKYLPKQMVSPVKWHQSMVPLLNYERPELMPTVIECGPSNGLAGMLVKINGKVRDRIKYIS